MKKISKDIKWFLVEKGIKKGLYLSKRKEIQRISRYNSLLEKIKKNQISIIRIGNTGKIKKITPPSNFSFINNTEEILKYFNNNHSLLNKGYSANFDLSDVENITFDAIALLMAKIKDHSYTKGNRIFGVGPNKLELKNVFTTSGFLQYVNSDTKLGKISGDMLHHVSDSSADPDISRKICKTVSEVFYPNSDKKYQKLNPVFVEAMANTTDHAGLGQGKKFNWWAFYHVSEQEGIIRIAFIDLGVGIFKTLSSWGRKFFGIGHSKNCDRLRSILKGEVKLPSRTKQKERGNGLISMNDFSKEKEIDNFIIISNNVYANINKDVYRDMRCNFQGTFLYWEMKFK